jgi:hypothetical protein
MHDPLLNTDVLHVSHTQCFFFCIILVLRNNLIPIGLSLFFILINTQLYVFSATEYLRDLDHGKASKY